MLLRIAKQEDKQAVIDYINKLPGSKRYDVDISLHREQRSISQNSLYWLWLACICSETGSDKDQVHDELRKMYLPKIEVIGLFGEVNEKPVSTSKLTTQQFKEYLDKIQAFAGSELGIILPLPEDKLWSDYYETYKNKL